MHEAMLPMTFQNSKQLYFEGDSTIRREPNEIRSLSSTFLPTEAIAELKDGHLDVQYFYDINERPGRPIVNKEGFSIQLGQRTQKVLSLRIELDRPNSFRKRMQKLLARLDNSRGSSASAKKHYQIIASSLRALEELVLQEGF